MQEQFSTSLESVKKGNFKFYSKEKRTFSNYMPLCPMLLTFKANLR